MNKECAQVSKRRPVAGLLLVGLAILTGAGGCSQKTVQPGRPIVSSRLGTATPGIVQATSTTERLAPGVVIDWSRGAPLPTAAIPTAMPTLPIDPAGPAPTLTVTDQLGGEVRLLGSVDGDPLAAVGPRILRFGGHGGWTSKLAAASPVLPGVPTDLEVFGRRAVVATTRGLTVVDLDSNPMRILSNLALGQVFAVAMHGSTALALPADSNDPKGRLVLVDLEDPAQPRILRTVGLPTSASKIAVFGNTAFLSGRQADPIVLDLTVPGEPKLLRSGPWPWPKGKPPVIRHFQREGQYLLVVDQPESDEADRRCLYLFKVSDGANPTLVQTDTCPFGSVQWVHIVGRTVVLRYDDRTDVLRIGEPRERKSLEEVFGNRFDYYPLSKTTAVQVGDDVLVAPIHSSAIGRVDALRITVASDGKLTQPAINGNSIDLKVRSVRSFHSIVAEGDVVASVTGPGSKPGAELEWLRMTDHGELEQVGDSLSVDPEPNLLTLSDNTLFSVRGNEVNAYSVADPGQLFRHVGVLELARPRCPEDPEAASPTDSPLCSRGATAAAEILGSLLLVYHTAPYRAPMPDGANRGPLVYDISDPRRPDLLGVARGDRLVASSFSDGRPLPEHIPLAYVIGLGDPDDVGAEAVVTWQGERAYLTYPECEFNVPCSLTLTGTLEARDPRAGLVAPPLATLALPDNVGLTAKVEVGGVPFLLVGRRDPNPGLYVVSIEAPDAPRLVGFVDLPAKPVDLAAAGPHVYVAAEWAGLIVLTAAESTGE